MKIDLSQSVVLVTGGARGIGAATVSAFSEAGATVYWGDLDGPHVLDVTSRSSFNAFVDGVVAEAGRIDVLVNNAGVMPLGPFLDEPDVLSKATFDVNVWG
jgi:NAD(P)-dependent dehydrogenase (short-subunit alcohol dehydrogenase family)